MFIILKKKVNYLIVSFFFFYLTFVIVYDLKIRSDLIRLIDDLCNPILIKFDHNFIIDVAT